MTRAEDLAAVLAQRLRLIDNGYRITPIRNWGPAGAGKAPYLTGWQTLTATADDAATWKRSASTGIICGTQPDGSHLVAVDIDILDPVLALEIEEQCRAMLGENTLLRIGRAPKRLLLYRCTFPATKLKYIEGGVELLGEGNQFVAFGIHPDTRRPYAWPTGDSPENTPLDAVPTTTPDRMAAFVRWLDRRLTRLNESSHDPLSGAHDDQQIIVGDDGLVRDGRELLLTRIVYRAFKDALPNPTLEGVATSAWETFRQRAFLGDGKWKRRDCTAKARALLRRWKAGEIGQDDPAPAPRWPQQDEIDAKALSRRIDADLVDFAAGKSLALTYPPGSGKTTKAIRAASRMEGRTLVYMPTKRLTAEHAERVQRSDDAPVATIFGRSADNCANYPVVQAAAERGIAIDTAICAHCPARAACSTTRGQYLEQFDTDAPVVLLSAAYLDRPPLKRLGKTSRNVIDEMPDFVGFSEMPLYRLIDTRAERFDEKLDLDVVELLEESHRAKNALEAGDLSPLDADTCEAMAAREWKFKAKPPNLDGLAPAAQLTALVQMPIDHAPKLSSFWKALADNVRRGEFATMWTGIDKKTGREMVRWNYLKKPVLPDGAPVLLLDGTVHPEIARAVFGPDLEIRTAAVKRNLTVIQVADTTVSKTHLTNSATSIPAIRRVAEAWGMPVIGPKEFDEALGSVAHFGALRGLNALENEPGLAVVSHLQLPPIEAERIACLLWPDKQIQRTGNYERQMRGYRMRDGTRRGAMVDVHPDPLVQIVVEHFREGGSIQAVDRLRSIHQDGKTLVLLSNIPLDLTVDRLVTLGELLDPLTVMAGRGVIPAHPAELAVCHPDLFPTYERARHWAKGPGAAALKLGEIPISISIGKSPNLVRETYRLASGGYSRMAWVDRTRVLDPHAWLEAKLGPLVYFSAGGDDRPDPPPPRSPARAPVPAPAPATLPATVEWPAVPDDQAPAEFLEAIKGGAGFTKIASNSDPLAAQNSGETADFLNSTRARGGFDLPAAFSGQYAREADPMPDLARDRLRAFRRAAGVTQHDMADLAGIARCTLANFEAGRFGLSLDAAARLRAVVASLPVVQASLW